MCGVGGGASNTDAKINHPILHLSSLHNMSRLADG